MSEDWGSLPNGARPGDLPWLATRMPDEWRPIESAPTDEILEGTDGWVGSLFVIEIQDNRRCLLLPVPRKGSYVRVPLEGDWEPVLWRRPKFLAPSYFP